LWEWRLACFMQFTVSAKSSFSCSYCNVVDSAPVGIASKTITFCPEIFCSCVCVI
jgi:hypothetical protein